MMAGREFEEQYYHQRYSEDLAEHASALAGGLFLRFLGLQPGDRVLDIGSGLGWLAGAMSDCGAQVLGIDNSSYAVERAQQRYPAVAFRVMSASRLGQEFEPGSLDAITCVQVLEHIAPNQVDGVIGQMARCLRDEGRLLLDVPVTDNISDRWLSFRNRYWKGQHRPPTAIDSSFDPAHLWRIGDLDSLIDQFGAHGLRAERIHCLYYVPWVLERLRIGHWAGKLPRRWLKQLLRGSTLLFRKGPVEKVIETSQFSAFWMDEPGTVGLARLKKLLA